MRYTVGVKEILYHAFYVEADTLEEAHEKFEVMQGNGDLDYSDGELIDVEVTVKPAESV